jgi:hypothetical protein
MGNRYDLNSTLDGIVDLNQQSHVCERPVNSAIEASSMINSSFPILADLPSYAIAKDSATC